MAKVVDRLLAQLPGLYSRDSLSTKPIRHTTQVGLAREGFQPATPSDLIGVWLRVLLGFALGGMMLGWPYSRECGLSLVAYLGAVSAVMLGGGWAAVSAWRFRAALPHILSLILLFWGIVLGAEQLLPRIGYATDRATWQCVLSQSS